MGTESKDLLAVLEAERKAIAARRKKLDLPQPGNDVTGIALSGGGIRSATLSLGVMEVLNKNCLLSKADYLFSVSGGGYSASYIHATLYKNGSTPGAFDKLFDAKDIDHIRSYDSYLAPSTGLGKVLNSFKLVGAFIYSFFMNLIWVLLFFVCLGLLSKMISVWLASMPIMFRLEDSAPDFIVKLLYQLAYPKLLLLAALIVFGWHFFMHVTRYVIPWLWSSRILYLLEGVLFLSALPYIGECLYNTYAASHGIFATILLSCPSTACFGVMLDTYLKSDALCRSLLFFSSLLLITGFFANPNILTFHRFYRDSLAAAYLSLVKGVDSAFKLWKLIPGEEADTWGAAPYPLINTCLNLLGRKDKSFAGTGSCEHFLLSPLFCGSRLTGYVPSKGDAYNSMTLATAMAVSGAAVNPGMGYKSNRFLSFVMTILNMRLGYWAPNPASRLRRLVTWWPWFHVTELFSLTDSKKQRISLSDGGQIENLGIYELLRRRCRLIIAVDASADPGYGFDDLRELVIQARNILGVTITFREKPEDIIRPEPSSGYSREHFAIADISVLPGVEVGLEGYRGILVYLKSSLKAPLQRKMKDNGSYDYKTYHPDFPHESTVNQFFDAPQWDAYRTLGQFIAEDMLHTVLGKSPAPPETCKMTSEEWYGVFDGYGGKRLEH